MTKFFYEVPLWRACIVQGRLREVGLVTLDEGMLRRDLAFVQISISDVREQRKQNETFLHGIQ